MATSLTDDHTNPTTNEGNLLSLITLQNIVGGNDTKQGPGKILADMAREETRHLMLAMKILTQDGTESVSGHAALKLQDKFGRDMNGAIRLGKLLKAKTDQTEVDMMLNPFVMDTFITRGDGRNVRGGLIVKTPGNAPVQNNTGVGNPFLP